MKVKVYWNLHRKCFSVQHCGKVVMHVDDITIYNPVFKVSEAGRQRVLREKRKNVHAFVVGDYYRDPVEEFSPQGHIVTYNPYKYEHFVFANTEEALYNADVARCVKHDGRALIFV